MHTQTCYQASLNASKSEFEAAQLEWKENQAQLQEQIWTLEGDKTRLEAQTSRLTSQLHEAWSNLEQQEKCSKQDADKVSKQMRHTCVIQYSSTIGQNWVTYVILPQSRKFFAGQTFHPTQLHLHYSKIFAHAATIAIGSM